LNFEVVDTKRQEAISQVHEKKEDTGQNTQSTERMQIVVYFTGRQRQKEWEWEVMLEFGRCRAFLLWILD
jgi:hypothetical protein